MTLPVVSGAAAVRALESLGFRRVSQRGSHVKLRRPDNATQRTVVVPLHANWLLALCDALRQAGLTPEQFQDLL